MRHSTILCAAMAAILSTASCSKEPQNGNIPANDGKKHVYAAGHYYSNTDSRYHACYWVDGVRTDLKDKDGNQTLAENIHVDEKGNVYVFGVNGSYTKACYWKNGVQTILGQYEESGASAGSVIFSGDHMIIGGRDNAKACVWIDGKKIPVCTEKWSSVNSMAMTDEGLVCEGFLTTDLENFFNRKWVFKTLDSEPSSESSTLFSTKIATKLLWGGSTLYAMVSDGIYDYYQNTQKTKVIGWKMNDFAIKEDGTVISVGMDNDFKGILFENGTKSDKYELDGFSYSCFKAVATDGNDIYVLGNMQENSAADVTGYVIGPDLIPVVLPFPENTRSHTPTCITVR